MPSRAMTWGDWSARLPPSGQVATDNEGNQNIETAIPTSRENRERDLLRLTEDSLDPVVECRWVERLANDGNRPERHETLNI